jgi:hypothetical protein
VHFPCPDIRRLHSISVQRKLHWQRTSDDEHSVCRGMGVLPATRADGHAACRMAWSPSSAEWTGHIKCWGGTSLVSGVDRAYLMLRRHITCQLDRQRASSTKNAWPRGLTSGSTRWLTSRAVGHVAASGLLLSGEWECPRYGLDTRQHQTPAWPWLRPRYSLPWNPGTPLWVARTPPEGSRPVLGVWFAPVEVLNLARRTGLCIQGSSTFPWGSGPTVATLEYIVSSGHMAALKPPTWRGQELFTVRLEITARAPCLHTVVRGTPDSSYRQSDISIRIR